MRAADEPARGRLFRHNGVVLRGRVQRQRRGCAGSSAPGWSRRASDLEMGSREYTADGRATRTSRARTRQLIVEVLETLPIIVDDLSWSMAWSETLTIARTHQLTAYDAAYLELASRQSLTLCTLDRELIATAPQMGIALFRTATT